MTGNRHRAVILAALAVLVGAAVSVHAAPGRVAVVDMDAALRSYHKSAQADAEIERMKTEYKNELGRLKKEQDKLDAEFEAARAASQEAGLEEKALQERLAAAEEKLMKVKEHEREVVAYAEKGQKQLFDQSMRMRSQLREEIRECIRKLAEKEGFAIVLDSGTGSQEREGHVIFCDKSSDITKQVIELLNPAEPGQKPK